MKNTRETLAEVRRLDRRNASLGTLQQLRKEAAELEQRVKDNAAATRKAVAKARRAGASWTEVGYCLGTTRQAAQQRYGILPANVVL